MKSSTTLGNGAKALGAGFTCASRLIKADSISKLCHKLICVGHLIGGGHHPVIRQCFAGPLDLTLHSIHVKKGFTHINARRSKHFTDLCIWRRHLCIAKGQVENRQELYDKVHEFHTKSLGHKGIRSRRPGKSLRPSAYSLDARAQEIQEVALLGSPRLTLVLYICCCPISLYCTLLGRSWRPAHAYLPVWMPARKSAATLYNTCKGKSLGHEAKTLPVQCLRWGVGADARMPSWMLSPLSGGANDSGTPTATWEHDKPFELQTHTVHLKLTLCNLLCALAHLRDICLMF